MVVDSYFLYSNSNKTCHFRYFYAVFLLDRRAMFLNVYQFCFQHVQYMPTKLLVMTTDKYYLIAVECFFSAFKVFVF